MLAFADFHGDSDAFAEAAHINIRRAVQVLEFHTAGRYWRIRRPHFWHRTSLTSIPSLSKSLPISWTSLCGHVSCEGSSLTGLWFLFGVMSLLNFHALFNRSRIRCSSVLVA